MTDGANKSKQERLSEMRRVLALLLAAALLFGLCACGSGEEDGKEKQEIFVNLPGNGKKAPSAEMITEDVRDALAAKNQYASLVEIETLKSLTEEESYLLTLAITAETKYADWTYEADLTYTKYDQGWMLDDVDWNAETYQLSRLPDEEEISAQIQETLEKTNWTFLYDHDSMEIYKLSTFMDNTLEDELIVVRYTTRKDYEHGVLKEHLNATWKYNPQLDCWEAVMEDGEIVVKRIYKPEVHITVDISGEWNGVKFSKAEGSTYNGMYTLWGFDAEWNGKTEHFEHSGMNYGEPNVRFSSENGTDILMFINDGFMVVLIGEYSNGKYNGETRCTILEELPLLAP